MLFLGDAYKIKVHFYSDHAGVYEKLLMFKFETCQQSSNKFQIMRLLEVTHRTLVSEEPCPKDTDSSCDLKIPSGWYDKLLSCHFHVICVNVMIMLYIITSGIIAYSTFSYLLQN